MTWKQCFEKYSYQGLLTESGNFSDSQNAISSFCENISDDNMRVYPGLLQIYISAQKDEMFLIIARDDNECIEKLCEKWDRNIMKFLNFGKLIDNNLDIIKILKYNIVQIVLCTSSPSDGELLIEKSVNISRKILLPQSKSGAIKDRDRVLLPFWDKSLKQDATIQDVKNNLQSFLPPSNLNLSTRREKHTDNKYFNPDEFQEIEMWLTNDN